MIRCDYCGVKLPKKRKRFCSYKHKDKYHNHHKPRGFHKSKKEEEWNFDDMDGHFSNEDN